MRDEVADLIAASPTASAGKLQDVGRCFNEGSPISELGHRRKDMKLGTLRTWPEIGTYNVVDHAPKSPNLVRALGCLGGYHWSMRFIDYLGRVPHS